MRYKIIGDSCMDMPEELKRDPHFQTIPLTLRYRGKCGRPSYWNL